MSFSTLDTPQTQPLVRIETIDGHGIRLLRCSRKFHQISFPEDYPLEILHGAVADTLNRNTKECKAARLLLRISQAKQVKLADVRNRSLLVFVVSADETKSLYTRHPLGEAAELRVFFYVTSYKNEYQSDIHKTGLKIGVAKVL